MRYAYVKNGDAVAQVRRVLADGGDGSGPDAFIASFLKSHATDDVLILSQWSSPDSLSTRSQTGSVEARSFGRSIWPAPLRRLGAAWSVFRALLRFAPDRIVCGCLGELLWVSMLAARWRGVPIVHSRHNGLPRRSGLSRLVSWLDTVCIERCDGVATHGPFLRDEVLSLGIPRNRVHEFDVDLSGLVPASHAQGQLTEFASRFDSIVMYVGRLQADKGIFDLLSAVAALPPSARVGVVIVGDGKDRAAVEKRLTGADLLPRALYLGRVPHAQVPAVMHHATFIVTPTRPELPEGRCMVALEALALGIPVIAPNCAAFPYAIRHGENGVLYTAGSVGALSDALARWTADRTGLERLRRGASVRPTTTPASFAAAVDAAFGLGRTRLAVVLGGHWAAQMGGAQFQAKCLVDALVERGGFDIDYLAQSVPADRHPLGYDIVEFGGGAARNARDVLRSLPSLYRELTRLRPQVIYQRCLMPYTGLCALFARRHGTRFVFHIASDDDVHPPRTRGWGPSAWVRRVSRVIAEWGMRRADAIVAQTDDQARALMANYGLRVTAVVPNFHPRPTETTSVRDPSVLRAIWVGNFKPVKDPEAFVAVAESLVSRNDVRFVMIGRPGDPGQYDALLSRIARLPNLSYLGEQSLEDVNREMASSDVLVCTSLAEGFPNTFIQAWLRGVPVLSVRVDPDGCLTRGGAGLVTGARAGLEKAVLDLASDREKLRSLGVAAREYGEVRHLPERAERLIALLSRRDARKDPRI